MIQLLRLKYYYMRRVLEYAYATGGGWGANGDFQKVRQVRSVRPSAGERHDLHRFIAELRIAAQASSGSQQYRNPVRAPDL